MICMLSSTPATCRGPQHDRHAAVNGALLFFFKQKTAYEIKECDWSSDVCSSELREFTSILNGTVGSVALGWHLSLFFGLLYIVVYFAFVLLAPTLLIAGGLLVLWKKVVK